MVDDRGLRDDVTRDGAARAEVARTAGTMAAENFILNEVWVRKID